MKKLISICLGLIILIMMMTGCNISQSKDNITINKLEDDNLTMGINYSVKNLDKGKYEIEYKAEEYEYGRLVKEYDLLKTMVENKDNNLKLGINYDQLLEEDFINILIEDNTYESKSLDLLKSREEGIAMTTLNENKELELNKPIVIAAYSIGGKGNTTSGLNIDRSVKVSNHNKNDLIIFLKIKKLS
ncbi:MAG TPA: hypothetical protein DDY58_07150 [Terrisporobacter glycolicus]|uniref:Lipoprotein n=1 Tax=Terrisporobacter petrolearius TaxID=1460447 RepID=A0ABZ3FHS7_9FIRM|nr:MULTISPECIES: hypothetical protein [Terrisporobacter]MBN9648884.1 hypothetical protein [Terrisporobacter glycolicus]HBI92216.1 hypothetical protein [Terrisporobacter hibernicus]